LHHPGKTSFLYCCFDLKNENPRQINEYFWRFSTSSNCIAIYLEEKKRDHLDPFVSFYILNHAASFHSLS